MDKKITLECRICRSPDLHVVKKSNIDRKIDVTDFAITDYNYGVTLTIYECRNCGLLQCLEDIDILSYYERLVDKEYEASRRVRTFQMRKLLEKIEKIDNDSRSEKTLLDIGAGSGILVEAALKMKFKAEGIEPSKWLCKIADGHGLPVYNLTVPNSKIKKHFYDVITIVDVIEHVTNPYKLISDLKMYLKENGLLVIITPDVKSLIARLLKWKWWHYRIAHINYFSYKTLKLLLNKANLEIVSLKKSGWYFTLDYLNERIKTYLPRFLHVPNFNWLKKFYIPLNLFDSILVVVKKYSKNK